MLKSTCDRESLYLKDLSTTVSVSFTSSAARSMITAMGTDGIELVDLLSDIDDYDDLTSDEKDPNESWSHEKDL